MPELIGHLLLQLLLIFISAFFAVAEIAVVSLNEKKVKAMAEDGDKKAGRMQKILKNPAKYLSVIQIGMTLAGFLGAAFAANYFGGLLGAAMERQAGIPAESAGALRWVAVLLVTLILSYFTLLLGIFVPKRIAMRHKENLARSLSGFLAFLTGVLPPFTFLLTVSTNAVLRLFRIDPNEKDEAVSEEDIVTMLDTGADEGTLKQDDINYIKNVFKLEHQSAADIMTPRSAVVAVPEDIPDEKMLEVIEKEGYSRIPVYRENIDQVVGILHASEYLLHRAQENFRLSDILHEPEFVPETIRLDALFKDMQRQHNHIAIVVNEYGLTLGIVTMEDVIEELVGEIWDEQDVAVEPIVQVDTNVYRVLSSTSLDDFFEFFSLEKDDRFESSTVNGWLSELCGCIPEKDAEITYENLSIRITQADEQMTHEVEVTVTPPHEEDEDGEKQEDAALQN